MSENCDSSFTVQSHCQDNHILRFLPWTSYWLNQQYIRSQYIKAQKCELGCVSSLCHALSLCFSRHSGKLPQQCLSCRTQWVSVQENFCQIWWEIALRGPVSWHHVATASKHFSTCSHCEFPHTHLSGILPLTHNLGGWRLRGEMIYLCRSV